MGPDDYRRHDPIRVPGIRDVVSPADVRERRIISTVWLWGLGTMAFRGTREAARLRAANAGGGTRRRLASTRGWGNITWLAAAGRLPGGIG